MGERQIMAKKQGQHTVDERAAVGPIEDQRAKVQPNGQRPVTEDADELENKAKAQGGKGSAKGQNRSDEHEGRGGNQSGGEGGTMNSGIGQSGGRKGGSSPNKSTKK